MSSEEHGKLIDSFGLDLGKVIAASRFAVVSLFGVLLLPKMIARPELIPLGLLFAGIILGGSYLATRWYTKRKRIDVYEKGLKIGTFLSWEEIGDVEPIGEPGLGSVIVWSREKQYEIPSSVERRDELRARIAELLEPEHRLVRALGPPNQG